MNHEDSFLAGDLADRGDRHSGDAGRDSAVRRGGKEKLIVLSAVKSEVKMDFTRRPAYRGARQQAGLDLGADAALFADVCQVSGKAVAGVDHGGGKVFLAEDAAEFDAGD